MRWVVVGLVLGHAVAACGGEGGVPSTYTIRDSAGIQVIESTDAAWGAVPAWSVSAQPTTRIGSVEGAEAIRFHRITSATRLGDGRLVVGDAGSGQVRIFAPDGTHESTLGSLGDGPGEFRSIRSLDAHGDSIVVFDPGLSRVTVYRLSGEVVTTWNVGLANGPVPMALSELRFLETGQAFGMDGMSMVAGSGPGLARDTAFFFELREGTPWREAIAAVPGPWTDVVELEGQLAGRHQALTSQPSWDAQASSIYTTAGDAFEFRIHDPTGAVTRLVRRAQPAPPVTRADAQAWKDALLEPAPEAQRAMMRPMLEAFHMPATLPVYASLIVDAEGHVWLGRFIAPGMASPSEWDVYAPDGVYLGAVATPPGLRVLEIGTDYVLGKWTDELDVEYVQLHRLERTREG
ncbi:MAG: hypothetical protein AMXMBFR53_30620 [Gemmatimonadota bacterium]